jgi:hypothetical protein
MLDLLQFRVKTNQKIVLMKIQERFGFHVPVSDPSKLDPQLLPKGLHRVSTSMMNETKISDPA